jgi:hypothetical protein
MARPGRGTARDDESAVPADKGRGIEEIFVNSDADIGEVRRKIMLRHPEIVVSTLAIGGEH